MLVQGLKGVKAEAGRRKSRVYKEIDPHSNAMLLFDTAHAPTILEQHFTSTAPGAFP
jgi:hypothetical protein